MAKLLVIIGVCMFFAGSSSLPLIIPNELPTILSLIYSNIPTIKKGTDSRLGWGFRLGDRADFQVLVELGPQKYTQPLANQPDNASPSKRNVANNLRNALYAQRQEEKTHISNTDGGKWIKEWSQEMNKPAVDQPGDLILESRPELGIGEIDAKSVIPDDSVLKLEGLYGKKPEVQTETTLGPSLHEGQFSTTLKPETTTLAKDALDNVETDD